MRELGRTTDKFYYKGTSTLCTGGALEDHIEYIFDNTSTGSYFGQLIRESNNSTVKTHSYDSQGRLSMTTSELLGYGLLRNESTYYDAYGRVLAQYDASGEGTLYHYNDQGYQVSMQGIRTSINYQTILSRNAFGQVTKERSGNGVYTYRQYDVAGRLSLLMSGRSDGGSELQYMTYDYDAVGNLSQRWDSRAIGQYVEETFSYDQVNRLEQAEIEYVDIKVIRDMHYLETTN